MKLWRIARLLFLVFFCCGSNYTVFAQMPPNISIEVEFKESGRKAGGVKGLGETYSVNTLTLS